MPTNLSIDDDLLNEALVLGGHRTKKDTVNEALREYVMKRKQWRVCEIFGQIEYETDFDYKRQRSQE